MSKTDTVFLCHILDAITQIETYVAGMTYRQFAENRLVQDGVIRQLEVIGEASRSLSEELRTQRTDLPWHQIIGLRNRLIHAYFDINLGIVWEIVHTDIPPLKDAISGLLG
jgi:uncharacterized protein with HEPN domain